MKKQNNSLIIKKNNNQQFLSWKEKMSSLPAGILLLVGIWGMTAIELQIKRTAVAPLMLAVLVLFVGLLFCWQKKWQIWGCIGSIAVVLASCIIMKEKLSAGMAVFFNQLRDWILLKTGTYSLSFEADSNSAWFLLLLGLLSGLGVCVIVRSRVYVPGILSCMTFLLLWACGWIEGEWFLVICLCGTLLLLAQHASGRGKALFFTGLLTAVMGILTAGILVITGVAPERSQLAGKLIKSVHALFYEEADNPMPEGKLTNLDAFLPSAEAALEVTMEHWVPLYIRGFMGGDYTEEGWQQLPAGEIAEAASVLYTLQNDYFFSAAQAGSAWNATGKKSDNTVTVKNVGACRAYAWLPYGVCEISAGILNPADLKCEGSRTPEKTSYSAVIYPVEESYLLQEKLALETELSYLNVEAVYRDWVYEQYLTIPEDAYELLLKYFNLSENMTTTQAKQEIASKLEQVLSYQESTVTNSGDRGFLSYTLEVSGQGYSVHYATLATLLLRSCGIPARYVEGYLVTANQAEMMPDGHTLTLTQKNSHAWAEYYLDGVGWIPFDATPGYTDMITYELPSGGVPVEEGNTGSNGKESEDLTPPQTEQPNVKEEENSLSRRVYRKEAASILVLFLVLLLLALILRTVILRGRLRKREKAFYGEDYRTATAGILCYTWELLTILGMPEDNTLLSEKTAILEKLLPKLQINGAEMAAMAQEIWFSDHVISKEQQEKALVWLNLSKDAWKQNISPLKRFWHRFIKCKVI